MHPLPNPTQSQETAGKPSVASSPPAPHSVLSPEQAQVASQHVIPTLLTKPATSKPMSCPEIASAPISRKPRNTPFGNAAPYVTRKMKRTSRRISTVKRAAASERKCSLRPTVPNAHDLLDTTMRAPQSTVLQHTAARVTMTPVTSEALPMTEAYPNPVVKKGIGVAPIRPSAPVSTVSALPDLSNPGAFSTAPRNTAMLEAAEKASTNAKGLTVRTRAMADPMTTAAISSTITDGIIVPGDLCGPPVKKNPSNALVLPSQTAVPPVPETKAPSNIPANASTLKDAGSSAPEIARLSAQPQFSPGDGIVPSAKITLSRDVEKVTTAPPPLVAVPARHRAEPIVAEPPLGMEEPLDEKVKPVGALAMTEDRRVEIAPLSLGNPLERETSEVLDAAEITVSHPGSSHPLDSTPQAVEGSVPSLALNTSSVGRRIPALNFGKVAAVWRFLWALIRPKTAQGPQKIAERKEEADPHDKQALPEGPPRESIVEGSITDLNSVREVNVDRAKVQKGDWVVLISSDGRRVLGRAVDGGTARIGRTKRDISALQGATWGTLFSCERNKLRPCPELALNSPLPMETGIEAGVDNRALQDCGENQRLSEREIARMKKAGISGAALIGKVVANSSTFSGKTQFSQEKYIKRKRQKFDIRVRVERPTGFLLCETYFQKSPEKTLHMRWDSLAHLMAYAGVVPNRHILVAENCIGLVTGTIAERLRGHGRIVNLFGGSTPPGIELIRMLNLSVVSTDALVHAPIGILDGLGVAEQEDDEPIRYSVREEGEVESVAHPTSAKRVAAINRRPKRGLVKQWFKDGFDCLVMAVRYDTVELFDKLVHYLAPSGTFAVYCTYFQEAAELQRALQLSKVVIRVELTEGNLIHHQMLPGRSHPMMSDSASGGYVVSGIRIAIPPITVVGRSSEEDI